MKHFKKILILIFCGLIFSKIQAQPNWTAIKANATFTVADTNYDAPYIQPINVGGWEDGLFITRDGKHLFSTYMPLDIFSWYYDLVLDPICFDFLPYFRPPLLNIDTVTNIWACPNFIHSDIITASRADTSLPFDPWMSSNMQSSFSFDGGAQGVLKNADTFDLFVFTKDGIGTQSTDIMFMRNVPVNPSMATADTILSTPDQEDNPHVERLNDSTLVLLFDRARYMYYSMSYNNGTTWQPPVLITNVLNDQAPYDVQPHLWNDGTDWWVYFCANSVGGIRGIYKSKQMVANDWNSWGPKELVIEGNMVIPGGSGLIYGIGEPTLTQWGDLSFVVVYGNTGLSDTTDVFDCDPWFLPKKGSPLATSIKTDKKRPELEVFPNPSSAIVNIRYATSKVTSVKGAVFNSLGILQKEFEIQGSMQLNIADLPAGIYFIRLLDGSGLQLKFVKV